MISLITLLTVSVTDMSALVASEVLRAGQVITVSNTTVNSGGDEGLIGREVKRTVYAGQEIRPDNTRSVRLVRRNQMVTVKYQVGALEISMSGRSLGEAGVSETVEVMNMESRKVITGMVTPEGWIRAQ